MKRLMWGLMVIGLSGCTAAPFVVATALFPDSEVEFQQKQRAILMRNMETWRYDAVEEGTEKILCHAGDKACHEALVAETFENAKHRTEGLPR